MATETTHWALVIGINHYSDAKEDLQGCVNDANLMKQYLEASIGAKLNVVSLTATAPRSPGPPLEEEQNWPTSTNIVDNLTRISAQAKRGDRVLIYFAGHGTYIPAGSTHALVILYKNGCEKQYFRLGALNKRVEQLIANGLAVTLVLDCCFSGAIIRGDDQIEVKVRCLDFDPTVAINTDSTPSNLEDPEKTRDAAIQSDWPKYATSLVVLCACAPDERTFEEHLEGKIRGLFTFHLLHALNMLVKNGLNVTHAAVHEHLGASLHAHWSRQTPMRYGKVDHILLGDSLLVSEHTSAVVYRHNGVLRLRAGEVHGIVKGDEFYASPVGTQATIRNSHSNDRRPNVRAIAVKAVESDLEELDGYLSERTIRDWRAEPMSSLSPRVVSVGIPPEITREVQTLSQEMIRYLRLVDQTNAPRSQTEDTCAYNVLINAREEYVVVNALLERVFPIPEIKCSSPDAAQQIVRILRHIAEFKYFEGLENRIPCPEFQTSFRIECGSPPGISNRINVMHNEKVKFSFVNTGDEQLYIGIFNLRPSWQMTAVTEKGFKTLRARKGDKNGTLKVSMLMHVPEYFKDDVDQCCEDHIKILITNKATHFHWSLPAIFQTIEAPDNSHRGDNDGLHASLADFLGDFRGHHQEGMWSTQSFFVRTSLTTTSTDFQ